MTDLDIEIVEQLDPKLGRQKVHDPRSRDFPMMGVVNRDAWVSKQIRMYDPAVNPKQCHGECTGCASAMMLNAEGNRKPGQVLDLNYAHKVYSGATKIDPWEGSWPPTDTGSSGLAAAKTAQVLGTGAGYRWIMGGADQIVQTIMEGRVVSVGTWWFEGLMAPRNGIVAPTGRRIGGHQYVARGYAKATDHVLIRCWWGSYRDVWIKRSHLNDLVLDGGDAHIQDRRVL